MTTEKLIKDLYTSNDFKILSREQIKDKSVIENFLKWLWVIDVIFVKPSYQEVWEEGGGRGYKYTLYTDFFKAFVIDELDILAFMFHEYLHHVQDRILWTVSDHNKEDLTIKERNFIEDMYANSWTRNVAPEVSIRWQNFLSNHDKFHNLTFNGEEEKWNSLLTSFPERCNIGLNFQYNKINSQSLSLFNQDIFDGFIDAWQSTLKNKEAKNMLNTMQINKEDWSHETGKTCETSTKKQKEKDEST